MTTSPEDKQQSEHNYTHLVSLGRKLVEKYGLTAENHPIVKLDPKNVPLELHSLIPYVEQWGTIDEERFRNEILAELLPEILRDLVTLVHKYEDPLGQWLSSAYIERNRSGDLRTKEENAFRELEWVAIDAKDILSITFGEEHEL